MRIVKRLLLPILLGALVVAACGTPPDPQALRLGQAPWADGEQSVFAVAGNETDTRGSSTFLINRAAPQAGSGDGGEEPWVLRRELTALGDQEIAVVEMETDRFRPVSSTVVRLLADGAVEQVIASYQAGQVDLELTSRQNVTSYERFNVPSDARDQRSLPFLVRTLPLESGYVTRINTFLPITGILDRVTVSVVGREDLSVPAGAFDTWRVRLDTGDSVSQLWVGVDAPHPIVKYDDGRAGATYELQEFTPGG
jgi:hypothetical protein